MDIEPESRSVTGIEKIKYYNNTNTELEYIYVNLPLNAFAKDCSYTPYFKSMAAKIFENGNDYSYFNVESVAVNKESAEFNVYDNILRINLNDPLKINAESEITLQFEARIPFINHRTGANDYAMWFGNFLPHLAVYDSNGWNISPYYPAGDPFYTEIANYNVTVHTPENYIVAGTGVENIVRNDDSTITTTLTTKLTRDFAFAVSDKYQKESITTESGVEISFYYYSDSLNPTAILELAEKSINYFSNKVASYAYTQLDIFETGLFISGGMEYPQVVFMDSTYLKNNPTPKSLIHEIGHQWFYNVIGNNQITNAWIDEGLTMVVQEGVLSSPEEIFAQMQTDYEFLQLRLPNIDNKGLDSDLSVYKSWSDYYNIQYTRGKLMIYSLNLLMGDEMFDQFIKEFYSTYAYKVADKNGFISLAEKIYGESLEEFFTAWFDNYELPSLIYK